MPLRLVTAPETEPVDVDEAKAHLRLEHTLDDDYVMALITAARQYVEEICWRGLVTQTWELVLGEFCEEDEIQLPKGNLASITSVTYTDANGAAQTLATSVYEADTTNVPGFVRLKYGQSWPATRDRWDAVVIKYVVGWSGEDVPAPIKQAILLLVSQMYEHRTPEVTGTIISSVKFAQEALLAPYRLRRF